MSKKEAPKKFKPTFANGGFWEHYKDLERQFENFLDYVPCFEDNENTYSFRLANLLLAEELDKSNAQKYTRCVGRRLLVECDA